MVNFLLVKGCFLNVVISIAELEAIELYNYGKLPADEQLVNRYILTGGFDDYLGTM